MEFVLILTLTQVSPITYTFTPYILPHVRPFVRLLPLCMCVFVCVKISVIIYSLSDSVRKIKNG